MPLSLLASLKRYSTVVADTGDLDAIARLRPQDATTNPSLLLQAAQSPRYAALADDALARAGDTAAAMDLLAVNFGREILKLIPGRVSTEVDARLSFDTDGTIAKAQHLIALYEQAAVPRNRVLVKIASTWEGIQAARTLEREGIHCNMTLLFGFAQAVACADAGVTLISPFVGRIYDWHKAARKVEDIPADEDPGVVSVTRIYDYYKKWGYATQVMAASFRKIEQVVRLAGCDLLTISPELIEQLDAADGEVACRLSPAQAQARGAARMSLDQGSFRWMLNEDAMASDKLAEGIRRFHADGEKLAAYIQSLAPQAVK